MTAQDDLGVSPAQRPRRVAIGSLLFLLFALFGLPNDALRAQVDEQAVVVTASGVTREDAIEQALFEVIRQVSGTGVEARQRSSVSSEVSTTETGRYDSVERSRLEERFESEVTTRATGIVSRYRILREWPTARGHRVEIEAWVPRYRVPGIDTSERRRLAVLPFESRIGRVDFFGPVTGDALAVDLSQAMLTQFVQSRRFAVLDRENASALEQEHRLLASNRTPIAERAKLGQQWGTDYLIVGELLDAYGSRSRQQGSLTGTVRETSTARVAVTYRILATATGEVRFADRVELTLGSEAGTPVDSRVQAITEVARQLVGIALDRIYPIRVVALADGGEVILGQGGSTLLVGERLQLVERGAQLTDPYSGESLGFAETIVGAVEVTRVDGRVAYARPLGGAGTALAEGQLARRDFSSGAAGAATVPAPTPRTSGVRLPFDR